MGLFWILHSTLFALSFCQGFKGLKGFLINENAFKMKSNHPTLDVPQNFSGITH